MVLIVKKKNVNRLEKLNVGTRVGKAKVLGTLIGIGGAMLLTFYKGAEIEIWSSHVNLLHHPQNQTQPKGSGNHVLGCLLAVGSCSSFALWLIIQVGYTNLFLFSFFQIHFLASTL